MVHTDVGIVHPGAMGAQVAAQVRAAGSRVWWLPQGRSAETRRRAAELGLLPAGSMAELTAECTLLLSVCPPAAALDVARQTAAAGFEGVYVDANAVSPRRMAQIAEALHGTGATLVDGGITGPPPREAGTTRLYLSGDDTVVSGIRALFDATLLTPVVLAGPVGRASALKLAFAAYNKISYALAAEACALAEDHGVLDDLLDVAAHLLPDTPLARPEQLASAGPRAWRWEPEMREIAEAWRGSGLTGSFADAAADTFERWHAHKDDRSVTSGQLLADLLGRGPEEAA
ncbi:NAD(P)-dependent oxidoreductase [Streptomyces sp. V4I2]|uniref:NAD(P)-dependent oxidoreductase n=1 Tax=Streptomyces sp. V4I2 TaxID=3042280 RepID=UPI00278A8434|nr:NAD(P)-dependent oxidoreductase [Streptomyces sp. V4I2]MDQ1042728.1 3-hydroxyisobutyrate dehydrogenase-like beta-hydroxyacid dehydrogenase [Streptomyces sp. V4I2]